MIRISRFSQNDGNATARHYNWPILKQVSSAVPVPSGLHPLHHSEYVVGALRQFIVPSQLADVCPQKHVLAHCLPVSISASFLVSIGLQLLVPIPIPELCFPILLGCAHGRRPRKRSPNNDTLRGLEGARIDSPENVGMLNRFKN